MAERRTSADHYPLHLKVGADFSKTFTYIMAGGDPKDWTGYTARAQMRPHAGSDSLILEFSVEFGSDGSVRLSVPADEINAAARGAWDLRTVAPDGTPDVLMGGPARISAVVTDDE